MGNTNLFSLQMECTLFFQENPYTYETIKGLELRLGRKAEYLEPILHELVSLSILMKHGEGEASLYSYINPEVYSGEVV